MCACACVCAFAFARALACAHTHTGTSGVCSCVIGLVFDGVQIALFHVVKRK